MINDSKSIKSSTLMSILLKEPELNGCWCESSTDGCSFTFLEGVPDFFTTAAARGFLQQRPVCREETVCSIGLSATHTHVYVSIITHLLHFSFRWFILMFVPQTVKKDGRRKSSQKQWSQNVLIDPLVAGYSRGYKPLCSMLVDETRTTVKNVIIETNNIK